MLTGKYSPDNVPKGPRGQLFKQILPGLKPLLDTLGRIATSRRKTTSQVRGRPAWISTPRILLVSCRSFRLLALDDR